MQDVFGAIVLALAFGKRNGCVIVLVHSDGLLMQAELGCDVAEVDGVASAVAESLDF
jgi:hypothetical protein